MKNKVLWLLNLSSSYKKVPPFEPNVIEPAVRLTVAGEHSAEGSVITIVGVGLIVTVLVAFVIPHRPVEVAVIDADPKNDASQFINPVPGFIVPAVTGNTE